MRLSVWQQLRRCWMGEDDENRACWRTTRAQLSLRTERIEEVNENGLPTESVMPSEPDHVVGSDAVSGHAPNLQTTYVCRTSRELPAREHDGSLETWSVQSPVTATGCVTDRLRAVCRRRCRPLRHRRQPKKLFSFRGKIGKWRNESRRGCKFVPRFFWSRAKLSTKSGA